MDIRFGFDMITVGRKWQYPPQLTTPIKDPSRTALLPSRSFVSRSGCGWYSSETHCCGFNQLTASIRAVTIYPDLTALVLPCDARNERCVYACEVLREEQP